MSKKTVRNGAAAPGGNPAEPPWIPILLDRPRRILFDFNALIYLGEVTGENMLDPGAWDRIMGIKRGADGKLMSMQPSPKGLRALLWAGLLADDTTVDGEPWKRPPELVLERVGHLLQMGNASQVLASIMQAQNVQADSDREAESERPTPAAERAAQPAPEESAGLQ